MQSPPKVNFEEDETERETLLYELLRLSKKGEIPESAKVLKKYRLEKLQEIKKIHEAEMMEKTGELLAEMTINKYTKILFLVGFVDEPESLERDLLDCKIFKKVLAADLSKLSGGSPQAAGYGSAAIITAKHVASRGGEEEKPKPPEHAE